MSVTSTDEIIAGSSECLYDSQIIPEETVLCCLPPREIKHQGKRAREHYREIEDQRDEDAENRA